MDSGRRSLWIKATVFRGTESQSGDHASRTQMNGDAQKADLEGEKWKEHRKEDGNSNRQISGAVH